MPIKNPGKQIIPIRVQGELVTPDHLFVLAMIAIVNKFGSEGRLKIKQHEAVDLIGKTKYLDVVFDFESNALIICTR